MLFLIAVAKVKKHDTFFKGRSFSVCIFSGEAHVNDPFLSVDDNMHVVSPYYTDYFGNSTLKIGISHYGSEKG